MLKKSLVKYIWDELQLHIVQTVLIHISMFRNNTRKINLKESGTLNSE